MLNVTPRQHLRRSPLFSLYGDPPNPLLTGRSSPFVRSWDHGNLIVLGLCLDARCVIVQLEGLTHKQVCFRKTIDTAGSKLRWGSVFSITHGVYPRSSLSML